MVMTLKELEKEVKALKKQVAENAWAKDHLEIWKLQSLYSHLYHIGRNSEVPSLFAQKTPGVTMELEDSGVYEGIESITYFWNKVFDVNRMHGTPGFLAIHMTVNPLIEINGKGTRAKGLWHSHGVCSFGVGDVPRGDNSKTFQLSPFVDVLQIEHLAGGAGVIGVDV